MADLVAREELRAETARLEERVRALEHRIGRLEEGMDRFESRLGSLVK